MLRISIWGVETGVLSGSLGRASLDGIKLGELGIYSILLIRVSVNL